jgi:phosphoribosylanthranilate isomerase
MIVKLKICGITNLPDAIAATEAGADYLGFIFHPASPRYITPSAAKAIIQKLPRHIMKVGVFVNLPADEIIQIMQDLTLDIAQLHGEESPNYAGIIGCERVWKAMALNSSADINSAINFPASAILADAITPEQRGGSGKKCDWQQAAKLAEQVKLVLAGGINPENIAAAITTVKPFAIDVCSGVEATPGIKDHHKIYQLIKNIKGE